MTLKTAERGPAERLNVAEAKRRFSDLLGRVAYGGETILITRRGRPMAKLVPAGEGEPGHLAEVRGWLDDDDSFFAEIEAIVAGRMKRLPRVLDTPPNLDEAPRR
jgi:prevent-host-death family protein